MFRKNGATRRKIMEKTAEAQATPSMVARIPRRWNKEINMVVGGTGLWGLAVCITAGDPGKITLLF